MSARKGSISRVTLPPPRVESLIVAGDQSKTDRPLFGVLQVVWRGRWIIICCLLISFVVGLVRVSYSVPVYHSFSTMLVQEFAPNVVGDVLAPNGQSAGYLFTQCEILRSTSMLSKALAEPGVADTTCLRGVDNPISFLKNAVVAGPESEGALITVAMDSTNANDAATIVNGVVSAYIKYQSEHHQQNALEVTRILQADVEQQQGELKTEQRQLTDFKKANPDLALDASDKGNSPAAMLMTQLADTHLQLVNFRIAVEEAASFSDDAQQLKQIVDQANHLTNTVGDDEPLVDTITTDDIKLTENALHNFAAGNMNNVVAIQLREKLKQDYKERFRQLEASAKRYISYLNKQYDSAQQRETELKKEVDANRAQAIESNSKTAEYDQLTAQITNTQKALDALYGRLKTVTGGQDIGALSVSILEPAKASTDTVGTKRSNALGMALVAGLMAGLGGAFLLEMVDQRLRSVEEVARLLAIPVLGGVPRITGEPRQKHRSKIVKLRSFIAGFFKPIVAMFGQKQWRNEDTLMQYGQTMHLQPRSDVAESYRAIRTAIYFALSNHPAKTILVTSPASGDGKTTLISNLAISIAQTGRRVLLIDADCWRPAQQDVFGITDNVGLTDVLLTKLTFSQAVHKSDVENLDVLPCGDLPLNPAELLESKTFADMLAIAAEHYDQILIDSPPVVPITDARILAGTCDATILVLRAGKSTRHQTDAALQALSAVGAPILGVVVNDAPRKTRDTSYQYNQYAGGRNIDWDQYGAVEVNERRASGPAHNGNDRGYSSHSSTDEIIEAEHEINIE